MLHYISDGLGQLNGCVETSWNTAGGNGGCGNGDLGTAGATICPSTDQKICVCPHGLTLQSFAQEARESGVDTQTLSQDTYLQLNVATGPVGGPAANSGEAKNIHMWVVFDQHYYFNANGDVTFSN